MKIHLPVDFLCAAPESLDKVERYDLSTGIPANMEGFDIGN